MHICICLVQLLLDHSFIVVVLFLLLFLLEMVVSGQRFLLPVMSGR